MVSFVEPKSLEHALELLDQNLELLPLSGGTDLVLKLHATGQTKPVLHVWNILPNKITDKGSTISIGAGVTAKAIASADLVQTHLFPLWEAARTLGSPQIRNRATLGGNIANASPAADMAVAALLDNATVKVQSKAATRSLLLKDLFVGPGRLALFPGELITECIFEKPPASYSRFDKLGVRHANVIAFVNFAIRAEKQGEMLKGVRVAWGSVAPTPVRSLAVEQTLEQSSLTSAELDTAVAAVKNDISPIDDHRASAQYRMAVAQSYLRRALLECQTWLAK